MRIALDARTVYAPRRRGIGRSLLRLYEAIAAIRPDWEVEALHRKGGSPHEPIPPATLAAMGEGFWQPRGIEMPGDRFDAWNRYRLPAEAARRGASVLHCPANAAPRWAKTPAVVTVHDLIPLEVDDGLSPAQRRRFETWVRNAADTAAKIVCVSKHTAEGIARRFPQAAGRLEVCHHGLDPIAPPTAEAIERVKARYPLDRPFVLHLGAAGPRKNTTRTLEAWSKLRRSWRESHRLVVVGLDPITRQRLSANLGPMGLGDNVSLNGFADAADLPVLMHLAEALVFPTLAEGFGLPVLEAFAAGTPVVTSDRGAVPEVAGGAAAIVDPSEAASIAGGLQRVLGDEALRSDLIARGRRRAAAFTWDEAAGTYAAILEAAAGQPRRRRRAA